MRSASPGVAANLSLSITNPLVLYRALVSTKKIKPDPAQHRLALQLQKLYFRLKDYAPEVEYRYRLERVARRSVIRRRQNEPGQDVLEQDRASSASARRDHKPGSRGFRLSALMKASPSETLALIRTAPLHNSALTISSPQGMLLYGEVGRGKSMLLDLLYSSLPSRQKRRWHYNTFMLDLYRRIETTRIDRLEFQNIAGNEGGYWLFGSGNGISENEHIVLSLAKDTISDSPILFLDEFQMPDRTASKLINSFFTAFFHLGGVLIASSNRMPEELSKAAGIEFGGRGAKGWGGGGGVWGLGWGARREGPGELQAKSDFGMFLEVLKARCEVWEMEGERDWRREVQEDEVYAPENSESQDATDVECSTGNPVESTTTFLSEGATTALTKEMQSSSDSPQHYHIAMVEQPGSTTTSLHQDILSLNPSDTWIPSTLTVYARQLHLPCTSSGILKESFASLCTSYLGPADYVSLCSTFHTVIITDVPVLTVLQKNEARRFITLLDALYEARCRLLVEAEAPPDKLFFPERGRKLRYSNDGAPTPPGGFPSEGESDSDSITSEAFSEMYQDSTAPFRPNITSYTERNNVTAIPSQLSFTRSLESPSLRSMLADEDADFGPTYGNGRSQGASSGTTNLDLGPAGMAEHELRQGPDFTQTSALTGEDERFAYKRARSRLWEMCGRRWWDERRGRDVDEWWRPVGQESRTWEQPVTVGKAATESVSNDAVAGASGDFNARSDALFKHYASPFRTSSEPPPKLGWQHAWGMIKLGKKGGEWGRGVEGNKKREERYGTTRSVAGANVES
ncbi:uncharacterized protein A1O9_07400 [Exophiala aquamarina CBS 119918]|uniref:AAA+ ATPase domain-containing protein n=1 Tax=Exophiala aquamarina CBS 119918 TaxID=1182545 RepID=A0A072PNX9_9EURO|nr:uncharacterized protein A1O9_07400 [Exophiala aquamarina CBS 119918]KEF57210.1 hypothetical protein A1O9_07400 [Exophiala aquamarina CBS 119918]